MARQDGPGSANFGTTAASQNRLNSQKGVTPLGSKKNDNAFTIDQAIGIVDALTGGTFGGAFGGSLLKYPLDGQTSFPARMRFTVHEVDAYTVDTSQVAEYWDVPLISKFLGEKPVSASAVSEDAFYDEDEEAGTGAYDEKEIDKIRKDAASKDLQGNNETKFEQDGTTGLRHRRVDGSPIIQIYMPQSLQVNDDIAYNQADLGPGGLAASGALNAGSSLVSSVTKGLSEGLESIFRLAAGQVAGTAAQVAAARVSQYIPKAGLRAAASTALQTGINPGTRMLFDRPNIRQFTFTFRFISTSSAEASQVERIIKTFREEMYPEELEIGAGIPAGYRFPNLFQVDFQFLGSKARFPKMQLSYLRSCQVTYNPNSMTFHADGQPTEVDMTLVFQEYRALSKQDIQRGY